MKQYRKGAVLGGVLIIGLLFAVILASQTLWAQTQSADDNGMSRLKLFAYPSGFTGIFDPATGMIYVYDTDLHECHSVRKLVTLGDPMLQVNDKPIDRLDFGDFDETE